MKDSGDADPVGDSDVDIARRAVFLARQILVELNKRTTGKPPSIHYEDE